MSKIKGKDTKPELLVRKFLFENGLRYKLHNKSLLGKPDIVFPKYKTVVFIHGCFWHGHTGCKYHVIPKTRTEWWREKINNTKRKDEVNIVKLNEIGWRVLTVWECELKPDSRSYTLSNLLRKLKENG